VGAYRAQGKATSMKAVSSASKKERERLSASSFNSQGAKHLKQDQEQKSLKVRQGRKERANTV